MEAALPQTPGEAAAALAAVPIAETLSTALRSSAARLADAIRITLDTPPGGPHEAPWRQTGALRDSIAYSLDGLTAQIGSNDPAASPQEHGTATIPPRPFFAPTATSLAPSIADDLGRKLTALLAQALT